MRVVISFLQEAKAELAKVSWPSQAQVVQYTITVIVLSLLVAIFLGALDWLFSLIVKEYFIR